MEEAMDEMEEGVKVDHLLRDVDFGWPRYGGQHREGAAENNGQPLNANVQCTI